jgi:drug/metabolite transporter (DMT)-like permease
MPESQTFAGFGKTDGLLFLMALIWGVNFSIVKFATELMQPLAFTGLRVILAATVLLTFAFTRKQKRPSRRDMMSLVVLGMLGNGIYQLLFVEGISRTRVGNAALVVAATPAFIAIISRWGGLEKISRRVVAGIALSLIGVGIVVLGSARAASGTPTFLGTMLVFGGTAAVCAAPRSDTAVSVHHARRNDSASGLYINRTHFDELEHSGIRRMGRCVLRECHFDGSRIPVLVPRAQSTGPYANGDIRKSSAGDRDSRCVDLSQ